MERLQDYLTLQGWKDDWNKSVFSRGTAYINSRKRLSLGCKALSRKFPKEQIDTYKQGVLDEVHTGNLKHSLFGKKTSLDFVLFPQLNSFQARPVIRKNMKTEENDIAGFFVKKGDAYIISEPDPYLSKYSSL